LEKGDIKNYYWIQEQMEGEQVETICVDNSSEEFYGKGKFDLHGR